mmetsp:Transcript_13087/g.59083  ORF Transcript_13087/g.59083 Transcript_13087/m.59083 type:complete len:250 (+) Transcript_13087:3619-4368(+)
MTARHRRRPGSVYARSTRSPAPSPLEARSRRPRPPGEPFEPCPVRTAALPRLRGDVIVEGRVVHALDVQRAAVSVPAGEHEELVRSAGCRGERDASRTSPRAARPRSGRLRDEEPTDARDDVNVAAEGRERERGSIGGPRRVRHPPVRVTPALVGILLGSRPGRPGCGRCGCLERAEEPLEVVLVPECPHGSTGGDRDLGAARGRGEQRPHRVVAPAHAGHRGFDRRPDRAVQTHGSLARELDRAFAER